MITATATALAALPAAHVAGHAFGFLFFLVPLFWIGVVVLIVALVGRRFRRRAMAHGFGPGGWAQGGTRSAERTLAERFAQGDIEEVEYRARLEVLRANRQGPEA